MAIWELGKDYRVRERAGSAAHDALEASTTSSLLPSLRNSSTSSRTGVSQDPCEITRLPLILTSIWLSQVATSQAALAVT